MNKSKINMTKAYENIINISLFNNIVSFIRQTSNEVMNPSIFDNIEERVIWYKKLSVNNIQQEYGFKYFGELLERYEQRIGEDIKDIRAIALALAYLRKFVTSEMIIGSQLTDFIKKIEEKSKDDIYLKGALYIFDKELYKKEFEDVIYTQFDKTEDIIFAWSLFYDLKEGFVFLETELKSLLGKDKTIDVTQNYAIYNWIIPVMYYNLKGTRNQDRELFKAIYAIPSEYVSEGTKNYNILKDYGYSKEEISFLNYISIFYSYYPKTVRIGKSIIEEKIAVNFCTTFLNSNNLYSKDIYDLVIETISNYRHFDIKCYEKKDIMDLLLQNVNIKIPEIFLLFYEAFEGKVFSFDIMDNKWDIVSRELKPHMYRRLFDNYLLGGDFSSEEIKDRIKKYNEITKTSYIAGFYEYHYGRIDVFSKLVDKDIISLEKMFKKYQRHNKRLKEDETYKNKMDIEHLKDYIKYIENKKAFNFMKYFLSLEKITFQDLNEYNFCIERYYSWNYELNLKRDFLTREENRMFISWYESFIFYTSPEKYIDLIEALLNRDYMKELYSMDELRSLYFAYINYDASNRNDIVLRNKYLSKEELKFIEQQEILKKKRKEEEVRKAKEQGIIDKFNSLEDYSFSNIYDFCYSYRWYDEETRVAINITKNYLNNHIREHKYIESEIINFNKICNFLLGQNAITIDELKNYILKFTMKGDYVYANNVKAS